MTDQNPAHTVRTKIVGVLIQDARQVRGMSLADCAEAAGCTEAQFEAYEAGQASPSLPELELLAYCMALPLTYFWGDQVLSQIESNGRAVLPAAAWFPAGNAGRARFRPRARRETQSRPHNVHSFRVNSLSCSGTGLAFRET